MIADGQGGMQQLGAQPPPQGEAETRLKSSVFSENSEGEQYFMSYISPKFVLPPPSEKSTGRAAITLYAQGINMVKKRRSTQERRELC